MAEEISMIVRTLEEVRQEGNEVVGENWISHRILLKKDAMGFSLHQKRNGDVYLV